jgi:hypothetical protein
MAEEDMLEMTSGDAMEECISERRIWEPKTADSWDQFPMTR